MSRSMWPHFLSLLQRSWYSFLSALGTTGLGWWVQGIIWFFATEIATYAVVWVVRGKNAMRERAVQNFKIGVFAWLVVMLCVYVPILGWNIVKTVYSDHELLMRRVDALIRERDDISNTSSTAYLEGTTTDFYKGPTPFPLNQQLSVGLCWENIGGRAAIDPQPYAKIYLLAAADRAADEALVRNWQADYQDVLKYPAAETAPIFPNKPCFKSQAIGPYLDASLWKQITSTSTNKPRKFLYVIGAVRFKGNTETYEARACFKLIGIQSSNVETHAIFQNCEVYQKQVKLK